MANMLSPGITIREFDPTAVVPSVSTSTGAYAGVFQWGPVMEPTVVSSEEQLVQQFWRPNNNTALSFFTAANFLSYSNNLVLVRADTQGQRNAVQTKTGGVNAIAVTDTGSGYTTANVTIGAPDVNGGVQAEAFATVVGGEIISVTVTNPGTGYTTVPVVTFVDGGGVGTGATATATVVPAGVKINNENDYLERWSNGAGLVGTFAAKYPGSLGNGLRVIVVDRDTWDDWAATPDGINYKLEFPRKPDTDRELHVLVLDTGRLTGVVGAVLEKFSFLSKASNGRYADGASSYYKNAINNSSKYLYWLEHPEDVLLSGTGLDWGSEYLPATSFKSLLTAFDITLTGGTDDYAVTDGQIIDGFMLLKNPAEYDISLVILGKANTTLAQNVIDNLVLLRKDCIAFVSPENVVTGEPIIGKTTDTADKILDYLGYLSRNTSYAVMDTGFKYQYDRYNDVYRWIPLNADIAGLCARTDYTNDPWFSPAGFARGAVKNVVRLAYSPDQTARDLLYQQNVNPVVNFKGEGTILYGDKTLQITPTSAFDRINVRRLFITLQKAISKAAKAQLFELNDAFTRAQFVGMVEPFLRDVQGRRGITDFKVVCDESNNTGEVIDTNRFIGDIYIKPARSINFISLNFIASRTGVSFEDASA